LTLEQLRIFVAVAEREHVTAAARALNLTQSAVSNAVAALEERHAVRLFDRVGRGIALNETGRAFLPEARRVLASAQAAETALTDMGSLGRGRVTLFASQTIASYWLPSRLVAFHLAHPGVELDVSIGNTQGAAEAVRDGSAELGLVEGELDDPALLQDVVGADRLVILAPPGHPLTEIAEPTAADLLCGPWVLRERGSGTRSTLEDAVQAAGLDPSRLDVALTLPSNEAVLAAAEAGAGAAALSQSVAASSVAAGRLAAIAYDLPARSYRLLRHKERYRSRAADALVASLGWVRRR
jgi:DNA-binding transcriptional LysR family regulator